MYSKVIFDLDGVITTENTFWDAAALTTAEFLGVPLLSPRELRAMLFYEDRLIRLVKNRGVNSNWDLVYLAVAFWETDGSALYAAIQREEGRAFELYEKAGKKLAEKTGQALETVRRGGPLWQEMADSMQEWFLGSRTFEAVYKKKARGERAGLWDKEEPIVEREALLKTLLFLKEKGVSLRIATARPLPEGREPLVRWGIFPYFDEEGAITHNFIRAAEEKSGETGLGKPHPYIFLKAYFGKDFPDEAILSGAYEKDFSDCLIVGDAGADLFAAQKMGADFAAVLTGVSGREARSFFEENGAKYILPDVTALPEIWKKTEEKK